MDLNLVPFEQRSTAVVGILRQYGAVAASKAVESIADKHGDKEARNLISTLPALAIADIVREFDYSKTSIVGDLLTPLQLRKVVERLPLLGGNIEETLCAVILPQDAWRHGAFFRELAKSELTLMALATVFDPEVLLRYARTGTFGEGEDSKVTEYNVRVGEWEELLFSLKTHTPSIFRRVVALVGDAYWAKPQRSLREDLERECRKAFKGVIDTTDPYAVHL